MAVCSMLLGAGSAGLYIFYKQNRESQFVRRRLRLFKEQSGPLEQSCRCASKLARVPGSHKARAMTRTQNFEFRVSPFQEQPDLGSQHWLQGPLLPV